MLPEPPLSQYGFCVAHILVFGWGLVTHSLVAPEALCQAQGPPSPSDPKPFLHPSSIAGLRHHLPQLPASRLCPGGHCSLLIPSPCTWTPLNLSHPFLHLSLHGPGPWPPRLGHSDAGCRTQGQTSDICYNVPAAPWAPGQKPTRTPHSNLSQEYMSPPRCCLAQGQVRGQSREGQTKPGKEPVLG